MAGGTRRNVDLVINLEGNAARGYSELAQASDKAQVSSKKLKEEQAEVGEGMKKLSVLAGKQGLANDIEDVVEGFMKLTAGTGVAGTALAATGVATVAATVAAAALVGGVMALVSQLQHLSAAAEESRKNLGDAIPKEVKEQLDELKRGSDNAAEGWDRLTVAGAALATELGGDKFLSATGGVLTFLSDVIARSKDARKWLDDVRDGIAGMPGGGAALGFGNYVADHAPGVGATRQTTAALQSGVTLAAGVMDGGRADANAAAAIAAKAAAAGQMQTDRALADLTKMQSAQAAAARIATEFEVKEAARMEKEAQADQALGKATEEANLKAAAAEAQLNEAAAEIAALFGGPLTRALAGVREETVKLVNAVDPSGKFHEGDYSGAFGASYTVTGSSGLRGTNTITTEQKASQETVLTDIATDQAAQKAAEAAKRQAAAAAAAAPVMQGMGVANGIAGGSWSSLSALGPYGAAIGGGIDIVMNQEALVNGITASLDDLAENFDKNLADLITNGIPALVEGIVRAVPKIIVGVFTELLPALASLINPFDDKGSDKKNFGDIINPFNDAGEHNGVLGWRNIGGGDKGRNRESSNARSREASRSSVEMAMSNGIRWAGGGTVTVPYHGLGPPRQSDVDNLVRHIQRSMGYRGRGVPS